MTPQKTKYFLQAMERIKARERLYMMDAAQYPTLQDRARKDRHKSVYKQAFPESFDSRIVKTTDLELI